MQGKKHNPAQIIKKLREADVMLASKKTIGQVTQALEISEQTFHRWRKQYSGVKIEPPGIRQSWAIAVASLPTALLDCQRYGQRSLPVH